MKRFLLLTVFVLGCLFSSQAQPLRRDAADEHTARLAINQNFADYLFLGTLNGEFHFSVHRNWTLNAGVRYNNWTWQKQQKNQFQNRRQDYYIGTRWWPWYTYSGWWIGAKLQYEEYNRGGIFSQKTEEGDAVGLGFGGGYSVQVNRWLNVDFGFFGWGGYAKYVTYACPYCGERLDSGNKAFFLPDELRISLMFVF